jgi:hypothetical protein
MKTLNFKKSVLFIVAFFSFATMKAQLSEATKQSFFDTVDSVNWDEYELPPGADVRTVPCYDDFISKISEVPDIKANRDPNHNTAETSMTLITRIDAAIKNGLGENIPENNIPGLTNPVRDKIFGSLANHERAGDFISSFQNISNEEMQSLERIHRHFWDHNIILIGGKESSVENCDRVRDIIYIRVLDFDVPNRKIFWFLTRSTDLQACSCDGDMGENQVKRGFINKTVKVVCEYSDENLLDMVFSLSDEPVQSYMNFDCCPSKARPDHGYIPQPSNTQNCCTSETATNTIAFKPGIAITDNFNNTSYDVAIEYARNFGDIGGNNEIFGGAEVGYMSNQAQEGEVTQDMIYGGVFVENRTPISECGDVQWVQGLNGRYGMGTIDAFGRKDDFTIINYGIHTGFNFDLSNSFSIGAQIAVLNLGNITYKNDEVEIKEDIGDLTLNKNMPVRFGFRFRF